MNKNSKQDRLSEVYDLLKRNGKIHSQVDLAKAIGASEATISKALKGDERSLTDKLLKRINKAFGNMFSLDWLLNGIGDMMCGCPPEDNSFYHPSPSASNDGVSTDLQRTHNGGTTEELRKENTMLKELLAEKERTIQILLKNKQ